MQQHTEPRADDANNAGNFQRSFSTILESRPHHSDVDLATVIREHGRERLAANLPTTLGDYLGAIDDLPSRRAPLDAAIDIALRSRAGKPRPDDEAVESLIHDHPDLALPIREAAVLAHALWSTGELRAPDTPDTPRNLPEDFGPALEDGRPRYVLTRRVGTGASGEVFLAEDRRLSDHDKPALVAIKLLRAARRDEFTRRRFIEEAAKARRLDHPGVVRVFDRAETDAGEDFIVYEFIPGGDLHEWLALRQRRPTIHQSVRLAADIARAVQAAHVAGLVHLDLKPANILMTDDGHPKVADFDLARRADAEARDQHAPLGTYAFMAPEQFLALPGAAAPPADIFAIAGILYWLITGNLPHGDSVDQIAENHKAARTPPTEPLLQKQHVDRDLVAIIGRAVNPDHAARYDSAGALADDLEAWLRREPIRWTHPGPFRVISLFARRRPVVFTLLLSTTVALVGAVIALEAARQFANVANENRLQAEVAAARLEAEQEWMAKTADALTKVVGTFRQAQEVGFASDVLTSLWILEWVHGPTFLANPEEIAQIWDQRIHTLRALLAQRRAQLGDNALETLTLETILAFWLTKSGDHALAIPLLESNLLRWQTILDAADPWLQDVQTILLAARATRLQDITTSTPATPGQLSEARSIATALANHDTRLSLRNDGAQLRLLIQQSLAALNAPNILDDPAARAAALETAKSLGLPVPTTKPSRP